MTLTRNIGRIDHISFLVSVEKIDECVQTYEKALGCKFLRMRRGDLQVELAYDTAAGLQFIAPIGPQSPLWARLREKGEGSASVVFGVDDLDEAVKRAEKAGLAPGPEFGPIGNEPWADQFSEIREVLLAEAFGVNLVLGRLVPK